MDRTLIENVSRIKFFEQKLKLIDEYINKNNYKDAYKQTTILINTAYIELIEKVYNKKIENPNIVQMISVLRENRENQLIDMLIEISAEYNSVDMNNISRLDLRFLLVYFDEIIRSIVKKHGNIF